MYNTVYTNKNVRTLINTVLHYTYVCGTSSIGDWAYDPFAHKEVVVELVWQQIIQETEIFGKSVQYTTCKSQQSTHGSVE